MIFYYLSLPFLFVLSFLVPLYKTLRALDHQYHTTSSSSSETKPIVSTNSEKNFVPPSKKLPLPVDGTGDNEIVKEETSPFEGKSSSMEHEADDSVMTKSLPFTSNNPHASSTVSESVHVTEQDDIQRWLIYWIIFILSNQIFSTYEAYCSIPIFSSSESSSSTFGFFSFQGLFYALVKIAYFYWLSSDHYTGAHLIHFHLIEPFYMYYSADIENFVSAKQELIHSEFVKIKDKLVHAHASAGRSKSPMIKKKQF